MRISNCSVIAAVLLFMLMGVDTACAADATPAPALRKERIPACRTPWACVGKDCGNWGTGPRPACRIPQAELKLVAMQMNVNAKTREERVTGALKLLERAADAEGPGIYVFPEYALCPLPNAASVAANQEPIPGPMTERFSRLADKHNIWIAVGMSETSADPKRPYNAIAIVGPHGQLHRYRKTHLWEPGAESNFRETQVFTPGESLDVFDIEGWRVAVMICFDGNFPEVPRVLSLKGAQIILYPNGRNLVGPEAEAACMSNMAVVVVSNYVGDSGYERGLGSSRILSPPYAKVVAVEGEQEGWVAKVFHYDEVERTRNIQVLGRCPVIDPRSRRPELYEVLTERESLSEK